MIVALALRSLASVAALDCFATVRIARSGLYTSSQKTANFDYLADTNSWGDSSAQRSEGNSTTSGIRL